MKRSHKMPALLAFFVLLICVSGALSQDNIIRNTPLTPPTGAPAPAQPSGPQQPAGPPPAEVPQASDIGGAGTFSGPLGEGYLALHHWDLPAADKVAEKLRAEGKADSEEGRIFLFRLAFFHGDYARARDSIGNLDPAKLGRGGPQLLERVRNLAQVMQGAIEYRSEHFIIRVTPGPDEILYKDAANTLEQAYKVLTQDLKIQPTGRVVVEIFPTFQAFSWATGLSDKDVETSGTVAVCKFSRLMVTTPRELLFGYSWRDTLSHEFAHYLIFLRSQYSVPIWLHEGIAKYEERRWRGVEGGVLPPPSQSLLATALTSNSLITFDEMEPTFAKLPSPMHAALAFAEVTSAVKYLVSIGGFDLVIRLVDRLKKNQDYKKAIREELGESYDVFYKKWIAYMKSLPLKRMENAEYVGLKVKKGKAENEDPEAATGGRKESQLYRYNRLGDLLRAQGQNGAALIEYRKALDLSGDSIILLSKTAYMYLLVGDLDNAESLLKKADSLNPMSYPAIYKRLGMIYMARKDWQTARKYLEMSADINPFDSDTQKWLAQVYDTLGEKKLEAETQEKIAKLGRQTMPLPAH